LSAKQSCAALRTKQILPQLTNFYRANLPTATVFAQGNSAKNIINFPQSVADYNNPARHTPNSLTPKLDTKKTYLFVTLLSLIN